MSKVNLVDVCDFQGGSQPPKEQWVKDKQDGYIRMLQIRDFTQGKVEFVEYVKKSTTTKICDVDDVLIGRYGASVGKILTGLSGAYNVAIMKTIPNISLLSKRYLYYFLVTDIFQQFILNVGSRAAQAGFNKEDLENIKISLPPLEEQENIVIELDKINTLIEKRKLQLEKLDLLVKSKFVEMFGDPVENPMGWEEKYLNSICIKITDGTHSSPINDENGEYKYITAKNIKSSGFDFKNLTYVTKETHQDIFSRCNPELGDVLYIKDGATTGIAMVNTLDEEFSLLSSVALLKQNREIINGLYFCEVLNNTEIYKMIRKQMGGAAITRLTLTKIKQIKVPIPPLDLQNQFADYVQKVEATKETIQKSLTQLKTLYKQRMQYYFEN